MNLCRTVLGVYGFAAPYSVRFVFRENKANGTSEKQLINIHRTLKEFGPFQQTEQKRKLEHNTVQY